MNPSAFAVPTTLRVVAGDGDDFLAALKARVHGMPRTYVAPDRATITADIVVRAARAAEAETVLSDVLHDVSQTTGTEVDVQFAESRPVEWEG